MNNRKVISHCVKHAAADCNFLFIRASCDQTCVRSFCPSSTFGRGAYCKTWLCEGEAVAVVGIAGVFIVSVVSGVNEVTDKMAAWEVLTKQAIMRFQMIL